MRIDYYERLRLLLLCLSSRGCTCVCVCYRIALSVDDDLSVILHFVLLSYQKDRADMSLTQIKRGKRKSARYKKPVRVNILVHDSSCVEQEKLLLS